jgi:hypothetical protein
MAARDGARAGAEVFVHSLPDFIVVRRGVEEEVLMDIDASVGGCSRHDGPLVIRAP